jgi:hypothetical protein
LLQTLARVTLTGGGVGTGDSLGELAGGKTGGAISYIDPCMGNFSRASASAVESDLDFDKDGDSVVASKADALSSAC